MEKIILLTVSVNEEGTQSYDMVECKSKEEAHEMGKTQFLEFVQYNCTDEVKFDQRHVTDDLFVARDINSVAEFNYYIKTFK